MEPGGTMPHSQRLSNNLSFHLFIEITCHIMAKRDTLRKTSVTAGHPSHSRRCNKGLIICDHLKVHFVNELVNKCYDIWRNIKFTKLLIVSYSPFASISPLPAHHIFKTPIIYVLYYYNNSLKMFKCPILYHIKDIPSIFRRFFQFSGSLTLQSSDFFRRSFTVLQVMSCQPDKSQSPTS